MRQAYDYWQDQPDNSPSRHEKSISDRPAFRAAIRRSTLGRLPHSSRDYYFSFFRPPRSLEPPFTRLVSRSGTYRYVQRPVFTGESSVFGARREKSIALRYSDDLLRFDVRTLEAPLGARSIETPFVRSSVRLIDNLPRATGARPLEARETPVQKKRKRRVNSHSSPATLNFVSYSLSCIFTPSHI